MLFFRVRFFSVLFNLITHMVLLLRCWCCNRFDIIFRCFKKYKSKHPDVPYKRNHLLITDNCRIVLSCFGSRIFTMILTYNLYVQFSFFNDKAYINVKIKFGFCLLISEGFQKHYFYNQSSVFIYFSLTWTN